MKNSTEKKHYNPPPWAKILIELSVVATIVAIASLTFSSPVRQSTAAPNSALPAPPALDLCDTENDGYLRGRLYGALDERIEWNGAEMDCEGMLRPGDDGIRLLFAARKGREAKLVFVFGIDGTIETLPGAERGANITIIDETQGRFFSSSGNDRCWATISKLESLLDEPVAAHQIDGEIYCAGGLPSLSDNRSVTIGDFQFSGRLALDES